MRKLKLLFAACALMGASATTWAQSWTSGSAVAVGEYYLYNIGGDVFYNNGSSWDTHSIADGQGRVLTVEAAEGGYKLKSGVSGGQGPYVWTVWSNDNNGDGTCYWKFTPVEVDGYTNAYTLQMNTDNKYLYYVNSTGQYGSEVLNADVIDSEKANNFYWLLIPKATREDYSSGSESNPVDVTYLVKNPDHEQFHTSKWTGDYSYQNNGSPMTFANFFERWTGQWNKDAGNGEILNNAEISQTLTALPAGKYRLAMSGFASQQSDETLAIEGVTIYAGEESVNLVNDKKVYTLDFQSTGEDVKIGVKIANTNANWVVCDNTRLYYLGIDLTLLKEAYSKALDAAEKFNLAQPMNSGVRDALAVAKEYYSSEPSTAEGLQEYTDALSKAVQDANASVAAYANAKKVIEAVDKVLEGTNVYNKEYWTSIKNGYDNETLTTEDAAAMSTDCWADRYNNTYAKTLNSLWKIGDKVSTEVNSGFYQNSWSNEGDTDNSSMTTPFFEYWVDNANALTATDLTTTVSGLTPSGTYNLSMLVRVQQQKDKTMNAGDITLKIGDGEAVNLCDGEAAANAGYFYKIANASGNADSDGNLTITISVKDGNCVSWLSFKNLMYADLTELTAQFDNLKGDAQQLLNDNSQVSGNEKTAVEEAMDATPTDFDSYGTAIATLQSAMNTFANAIPSYDAYALELTRASSLGVTSFPEEPENAAKALEAVSILKVAEYESVTTLYPYAVELGKWNASEGTASNKGQHWDGTGSSTYFEQSGANYNAEKWKISYDQDLTLPAGTYVFKVAGRTANNDNVSMSLTVKAGDNVLGTVNDFPKGDTGKGIDTSGKTNFDEGTFANDNKGRGWQWRYVKFDLSELTTINIAVSAEASAKKCWVSFCNPTVQAANNDAAELAQAIEKLNTAKKAAALTKITANVGNDPFQFSESDNESLWSAYESAKSSVDNYELSSSSTASEITTIADALATATENYQSVPLNEPASDQLFTISLANGKWASNGVNFENEAMTYIANDRTDHGNYNIKYKADPNTNLAQAFTFTKVEGNNYKLSQIDADGKVRFMCTGKVYGGNDNQIRTTTNADDAMLVTVIPTATEGVYNLRNVAANEFIGGQDAGVFTVNSHINFKIVETTKPSIEVNTTEAGCGTIIVPFAVSSIPNGVKVYSCAAVDGNLLTLTEVTALEANKPYIIEGSWNETLTGDAQGIQLTYPEGLLTGVYADQKAAADTYVMQNGTAGVGFYKVASGSEPTVGANHAFLTVTNSAREAYLLGEATAIKAIEVLTNGKAEIYNAAGARQQRLQKGVNIIKNGDKTVKVMVK